MAASPPPARTFRRDAIAWLALAALIPAGAFAVHGWLHRRILPPGAEPRWAEPAANARVAVLVWDGLVREPDGEHVHGEQLRAQLAALAARGFQPITLEALRGFLRGEKPVPPRSVLLSFDGGRLTTYEVADPVLRERRWPAAMFLVTRHQEQPAAGFLYWDRLQRMVDSGLWELAAEGSHGAEPIELDATGRRGAYLTRLRWLPEQQRPESLEEFSARIGADARASRELIESHLRGARVLAFAPPSLDARVQAESPTTAARAEDVLSAQYDLLFADDLFGVNGSHSDRRRLKRLRVQAAWTAEELAERVARAADDPAAPGTPDAAELRGAWVSDSGALAGPAGELVARGLRRAELWRAGSEWTEGWMLRAEVAFRGEQLWIAQRPQPNARYWRWGGDERGVYLQARAPGSAPRTLQRLPLPLTPGSWHQLALIRRGHGLWVEWDGRAISERPWALPETARGPVGVAAWSEQGEAELRLRGVEFSSFPAALLRTEGSPAKQAVDLLAERAIELAGLAPEWLEIRDGRIEEHALDRPLFRILGRRYAWEICPAVHVSSSAASLDWLRDVARRAQSEDWPSLCFSADAALPRERAEEMRRGLERALAPRIALHSLPPPPVADAAALARQPRHAAVLPE